MTATLSGMTDAELDAKIGLVPARPGHTCVERTGESWSRNACGRPAKFIHTLSSGVQAGTQRPLCGVHAAAVRRVVKNDMARQAETLERRKATQERQRRAALANNVAMLLSDKLGVPVSGSEHGRTVEIDVADAQRLLSD